MSLTESPAHGIIPLASARIQFNQTTTVTTKSYSNTKTTGIPVLSGSFWTHRQRQSNAIHEVPYRACFKPELAAFFINQLSRPGDRIFDPFMGRGTTPLEAALLDRIPMGCDLNPLSSQLLKPRLNPPKIEEIQKRLQSIDLETRIECPDDLLAFYHPKTLRAICNLRKLCSANSGDAIFDWIRMVTLTRLTGHSSGFLSVYTLPPNQAVSVSSQKRINRQRGQRPPERDPRDIVMRKSKALLRDLDGIHLERLKQKSGEGLIFVGSAQNCRSIADDSIQLIVTSPPFLDVVDYEEDNWLRLWFAGLPSHIEGFELMRRPEDWQNAMRPVFREIYRILKPDGWCAFEIGEVNKGRTRLEDYVVPLGIETGLLPEAILINQQTFTKTAHCWGVSNGSKGTNTNRIVLMHKR